MDNKSIFDAWVETNNKLMNNWATSTQKLQEAVQNGQALEKGTDIYQEWLNNQTEIAREASEKNTASAGTLFSNPFNGSGKPADLYNQWFESQQNSMKTWFDNSQKFFAPFTAANPNDAFAAFRKSQEQWMETNSGWMNQWIAPFKAMTPNIGDTTAREAYENMVNMSNTYFKLYEVWAPFYKSISEKNFTPETFQKYFDAGKFKDLMDKSFEAISPVQLKDLYNQFSGWFEVINNHNRHLFQQYAGNMPQAEQLMPFLLFGNDPKNAQNNIFSVYQRSINPLIRLYAPGKESELNEIFSKQLDRFSQYGQKLNELQHLMYTTGSKNFEKFVFDSFEESKKGTDMSNFQQVFQNWVNKNESAFVELFRTEAYSKLQGELLDLGLEIKNDFEKVAEISLQPLPVVLRTEADELHQTIYELKKRVRQLEKLVGAGENEEEKKEAKSSKKKAATA
ncbi:MAG: Poly(R)-hydroxyalkanoic acid synthase subunit (PHAsynthIIIE) [Bacteroidetes bacterium]|nr:MAG: Poly(R)-hydroxyalkanoic acid synthase subunit (PHAsynthIIIE) [Bacteroidota bacterium]